MKLFKYPRTKHCPWSRSKGEDDKEHKSMKQFIGREIVATEKMDGENTSMYSDHYHARSVDSRHHPSRDVVKAIWGEVRHQIPENWRMVGENLFAKHSIHYDNLDSYFYGFSIWDERNVALDWDTTLELFKDWGITPVPELYRGVYDESIIKTLWNETKSSSMEGYVIRVVDEIPYDDFALYAAKFVRKNHVQTSEHWMHSEIVPNKLKGV